MGQDPWAKIKPIFKVKGKINTPETIRKYKAADDVEDRWQGFREEGNHIVIETHPGSKAHHWYF